jgi:hypothetical protein
MQVSGSTAEANLYVVLSQLGQISGDGLRTPFIEAAAQRYLGALWSGMTVTKTVTRLETD